MSVSKVTSMRWELVDFWKQRHDARGNHLTSNLFSLSTRSSVQFALFIQWEPSLNAKDAIRVILKQVDDKSIEARVKIWVENTTGQRFGETFVEKHVFNKIGDQCDFNGIDGNDWSIFWDLYQNHGTFFVCCEITDLNERSTPTLNHDQKFHHNHWTLFEKEYHDAIIKVDGTAFKVVKAFFVSQSEVFEKMFASNFKEGITNEVEIQDTEAETMQHLIKWVYTGQFEKEALIEKLFTAADKYDIALLKEICTEKMLDSLDASNAFQRLILASIHSDKELEQATLNVISELTISDFAGFLASDDWADFTKKNEAVSKEVAKLIRDKVHK